MHVLRVKGGDPLTATWKRDVAHALRPGDLLREEVALLLALNPPLGYFPDFLTPAAASAGFEVGLDEILSTSKRRLKKEIATLGESREGLPSVVSDLGDGNTEALRKLATAITRYHEVAITPIWDRVRAAFDADRAVRARAVLDGGTAALLDSLHPTVRFVDNVLEISDYPTTRKLHLDGRGLLLVPSYFKAWSRPVALVDPHLPPVLVYSIDRSSTGLDVSSQAHLTPLIGRTRAAVLELVGFGSTTGELARRLRVSPAAVSQHVTVLRDAGLLLSTRDGNTVHHTLTPLGFAMLNGS
jgi:DNA-binding transcriptional ArsR family regulator